MREYHSTHCEMLVIGSRTGGGGRPGTCEMTLSIITSTTSANSRSSIFFTTLGETAAAGWNGPGVFRCVCFQQGGVYNIEHRNNNA